MATQERSFSPILDYWIRVWFVESIFLINCSFSTIFLSVFPKVFLWLTGYKLLNFSRWAFLEKLNRWFFFTAHLFNMEGTPFAQRAQIRLFAKVDLPIDNVWLSEFLRCFVGKYFLSPISLEICHTMRRYWKSQTSLNVQKMSFCSKKNRRVLLIINLEFIHNPFRWQFSSRMRIRWNFFVKNFCSTWVVNFFSGKTENFENWRYQKIWRKTVF